MPAATTHLLDDSAVNIDQWIADEVRITFAQQVTPGGAITVRCRQNQISLLKPKSDTKAASRCNTYRGNIAAHLTSRRATGGDRRNRGGGLARMSLSANSVKGIAQGIGWTPNHAVRLVRRFSSQVAAFRLTRMESLELAF